MTLTPDEEDEPYVGSSTYDLDVACQKLFGEEWAPSLHKATGIALRTCQRIRAAARGETEHEAAEGVLNKLREVLSTTALECDVLAGEVAETAMLVGIRDRRKVVRGLAVGLIEHSIPMGDGRRCVGPIDAADYLVLFDQLEALERSLVETSRAITNALGTKASAAAKRPLFKALAWAAEGLDAVYEIDARGLPRLLLEGQPILQTDDADEGPEANPVGWDALLLPVMVEQETIQSMAEVCGSRSGVTAEAIQILAEGEDEELLRWALAITVDGDLVAEAEQLVFGLRRLFDRDATVRWLRDAGPYRKGGVTLFRREPGEQPRWPFGAGL